jgi:gentisate 1,2-dioxygenase
VHELATAAADFDARLGDLNLERFGASRDRSLAAVLPHIWKWPAVLAQLQTATALWDRASLHLINPGLKGGAGTRSRSCTRALRVGFQITRANVVTSSHRHNFSLLFMLVQGRGGYAVVDGEQIPMDPGDLLHVPSMAWHGQGGGSEPTIWLEVLDSPLVDFLPGVTFDPLPGEIQPICQTGGGSSASIFRWAETYQALQRAAPDPYDGLLMAYGQAGGARVPASMDCWSHLLRPGARMGTHRHNTSTLYFVLSGSGTTVVDERRFDWQTGDAFLVPAWSWHRHEHCGDAEATLFSVSERPVTEHLGLYREEAREE